MMPMPPTSRLTAATAPSSVVITLVVPESVSASCLVSSTLKLSSSESDSLRSSRSSCVRLAFTRSGSLPSFMDTSSVFTRVLPVTRRCSVRSGTNTVSSWSLPNAPCPLDASTPTTSHENAFTRSWPPTASAVPNSSRRTVSPIRQTAAPARNSASVKTRPVRTVQLPVSSQALVLPITLVVQLRPPTTAVAAARASGATARMPPICCAITSASVSLKAGAPVPPPGPMRWPGRTCSRLVPRPEIWFWMASVAPLPSVTMVITALTPITMPRMVRNERIRLRRMERNASSRVLSSISGLPHPNRPPPAGPMLHQRPVPWGVGWPHRCPPRHPQTARCAARTAPCRARA